MNRFMLIAVCMAVVISAFGQSEENIRNTTKKENQKDNNSVKSSIKVNATPAQVWEVLTSPEKIAKFTGSDVETDWKIGSPITWSGEMQGAPFKNKGKVLEVRPGSLLRHSFRTGMGGYTDQPENYSEVAYSINQIDNETVELTYSRINIATEMEAQMFQQHIQSMLEEIKRLSEE